MVSVQKKMKFYNFQILPSVGTIGCSFNLSLGTLYLKFKRYVNIKLIFLHAFIDNSPRFSFSFVFSNISIS